MLPATILDSPDSLTLFFYILGEIQNSERHLGSPVDNPNWNHEGHSRINRILKNILLHGCRNRNLLILFSLYVAFFFLILRLSLYIGYLTKLGHMGFCLHECTCLFISTIISVCSKVKGLFS